MRLRHNTGIDCAETLFRLFLLAIQGRISIPQIKTEARGWGSENPISQTFEIVVIDGTIDDY